MVIKAADTRSQKQDSYGNILADGNERPRGLREVCRPRSMIKKGVGRTCREARQMHVDVDVDVRDNDANGGNASPSRRQTDALNYAQESVWTSQGTALLCGASRSR